MLAFAFDVLDGALRRGGILDSSSSSSSDTADNVDEEEVMVRISDR